MKLTIMLLSLILSLNLVIAYEPPLYIANPEAKECRYYFAGDANHFNPRPENFTINIGYTTDFESLDQACNIFKCIESKGEWDKNRNNCICKSPSIWDKEKGCIKKPNFFTGFVTYIKNLFKITN